MASLSEFVTGKDGERNKMLVTPENARTIVCLRLQLDEQRSGLIEALNQHQDEIEFTGQAEQIGDLQPECIVAALNTVRNDEARELFDWVLDADGSEIQAIRGNM